jgi:hypothetical protein
LFPTDSVILDYTVEEVREYKYLGHEIRITTDNQTQEELRVERRTSLGWAAYDELKDVFNSEIPISLKRKVYDQCVFPVQTLDVYANNFPEKNGRGHVWDETKRPYEKYKRSPKNGMYDINPQDH